MINNTTKICPQCEKELKKRGNERLGEFKKRKYCNQLCYHSSLLGKKRPPFSKEAKEKISKALTGRKLSEKHKQKLREIHRGKNNHFYGKKHTRKTKKKISDSKKGKNMGIESSRWKGGRSKTIYGYIIICKPNHPFKDKRNYVREHRLVMEEHLERYLRPEEVVHHINGVKDDNRLENLFLFNSEGNHRRHHIKLRRLENVDSTH